MPRLRAAVCWALVLFAVASPATPFAIDEEMLHSEDPLYEQCLQLFLDFTTKLGNDVYITECHNGSDNITSHCFTEYAGLCGPGQLPEITTTCEPQLDKQSGDKKKNAVIRPMNRKKAKCVARVLIVMMANNNVGLCTALQLCSEGYKAPQCKERYTLFKESMQQFCLFPGLPTVTPGTLRRKTDVVEKCKGDLEKCNLTAKILGFCLGVAGIAICVVLFIYARKWIAACRDRRGKYTLAEYVPPINAATSATRLGPDYRTTPEGDDVCSFLSQEGAGKWSEFSSTPKSRQFEAAKEGKQNQQMSLTTTLESSYSEGEVCSSCCNYGSTHPDSSESKPSALSDPELVSRRPGRSREFPHSPVGRGVGSSLGRGYYSESGAGRLTVCERAQAWRNMVAHRLQAYPNHLSNSLPSKISRRDSSPINTTRADKTDSPPCKSSRIRCARSEHTVTFGGGEKLTDGTRFKGLDPWVKRKADRQKGLEVRKDGKLGQNGIPKTQLVTAEIEMEQRGRRYKQSDIDQKQRAEKAGPSRIPKTEVELKDVGRKNSEMVQKISESIEEIESIITTV